jgi:acyl carrier protein
LLFQKGATEDFGLWLMEVPNGLEGGFIYNADMYNKETAAHLCTRYLELLHLFANNPETSVDELGQPGDSVSGQFLTRLGREESKPLATTVFQARTATGATSALSVEAMPLAKIWARLLQIEITTIRPEDNFFDLGGSSLLAMQAMEATERELGLTIDAQRYIYEGLAQLAATQPAATGRQPKGFLGRLMGRFEKK